MLKRPARFCRGLVSKRQVWPDRVVVIAPEGQLSACILQAVEDLLVQQLVPQAAVEALDEGVLLRLARIDVVPGHPVLVSPFQNGPAGELCPVLTDNAAGLAADPDQGAELPGHSCARQAGVRDEAQAFPRAVVDHRQDTELPRGAEAVRHEVQRPTPVGMRGNRQRCPGAARPFPAAAPFYRQPFLAVDTIQLLVVHGHALALQQDADPAVAEPTSLASDLLHLLADLSAVRRAVSPDSPGIIMPASCSLIVPIICASVKRLFRIRLLLQSWRRLYITVRDFAGGRSTGFGVVVTLLLSI